MEHTFKSSFGQCECLWCGRRRGADCPVTFSVRLRVAQFAKENGRMWKSKLRSLWISGKDEGDLRNARNAIGPSQLDKITQRMLDRVLSIAHEIEVGRA